MRIEACQSEADRWRDDQSVVALDADTKNSTFSDRFMKEFPDRFFECFIAEQNMMAAAGGLAAGPVARLLIPHPGVAR